MQYKTFVAAFTISLNSYSHYNIIWYTDTSATIKNLIFMFIIILNRVLKNVVYRKLIVSEGIILGNTDC